MQVFSVERTKMFSCIICRFQHLCWEILNVDSNKVKGVELGVQYHFNEKVNVGGNFSSLKKTILQQDYVRQNKRANAF